MHLPVKDGGEGGRNRDLGWLRPRRVLLPTNIPAFATDLLSAQTQKQGCGKGLAWAIRTFPGLGKILTFLPGRWIAGFCLEEVGMMLVVVI